MQRQLLGALLSLALAAVIVGCGSTEQNAATDSLIQAQDLPAATKSGGSLPSESCSPLEVLARDESKTAESSLYAIARVRVQEAVGVFAASRPAVTAYDALNAKTRLDCIRKAIASKGNLYVQALSGRDLNAGDEAHTVPFVVLHRDSGQRNSVEVTSIRSGRSVASLIFVSTMRKLPGTLVHDVVDTAAEQLARARSGR